MSDQKRGHDAADEAAKINPPNPSDTAGSQKAESSKQDAPNYQDRIDGGRAIPAGQIDSANDE